MEGGELPQPSWQGWPDELSSCRLRLAVMGTPSPARGDFRGFSSAHASSHIACTQTCAHRGLKSLGGRVGASEQATRAKGPPLASRHKD